jgi:hypothetical protein
MAGVIIAPRKYSVTNSKSWSVRYQMAEVIIILHTKRANLVVMNTMDRKTEGSRN